MHRIGINRRGAAARRAFGLGLMALTLLGLLAAAPGVLAATIACLGGNCLGTNGEDTMQGTGGVDTIIGYGGADAIAAGGGNDVLVGDNQLDKALDGSDRLAGGGGGDYLEGLGGADLLAGGPGGDDINAREYAEDGHPAGTDTVRGGRGNDVVYAADGHKDVVDCGPGADSVWFDQGLDSLANCEVKHPV